MIKINVWLTTPEGKILPAGEMVVASPDASGALEGQYRYSPEYLHAESAVALDPIHLPLSDRIFDAKRPYSGVHGVFEDSLPDDWGRKLLVRRYKLAKKEQRVPHLLKALESEGIGALSFGDEKPPTKPGGVPGHELKKLVLLAEQYEKDTITTENDLALLFEAGSSPGGARPKAVVHNEGKGWLAKFPSIQDTFDVVALEAATMCLARKAGVQTAHTELFDCGSKRVLLVERFDITPSQGRRHLVSMQTLLGAEGHYFLGYQDMAGVIRRISANPADDLDRLFRQMVYNVLIGNTDDHLKNFCMLHGEEGWHLSPAFDLVPNINRNREQQLRVGDNYSTPTREALLQEAKSFGIKRQERAKYLIDHMCKVVAGWQDTFEEYAVPAQDIEILRKDILSRLKKIGR